MENVNRDKYYISPFSTDLRMGQVNFYPSCSVTGFWIFPWVRYLNFFCLSSRYVHISYAIGSSEVPLDFQVPWPSSIVKIATVCLEVWSNFGLGFDVTNL